MSGTNARKVGVVGGGIFTRLLHAPATALNLDLRVLSEANNHIEDVIPHVVIGEAANFETLSSFIDSVDLVTFTSDQLSIGMIRRLESKIHPSTEMLSYINDPALLKSLELPIFELPNQERSIRFSILLARSPHGQIAIWAPTQLIDDDGFNTITPAPDLSEATANIASATAAELAQRIGVVGAISVDFVIDSNQLVIDKISHPTRMGMWTLDGSMTSFAEQHLRAILDLPLGDTSLKAIEIVTGEIKLGDYPDLHRAYLHLFAENPRLKVHLFGGGNSAGETVGFVALPVVERIDDFDALERVRHATDYFAGVTSGRPGAR